MELLVVVTVLAAFQFIFFGVQVGSARGRSGVKAPAMSGNEDFERHVRVQQNTLEQLVIFFPALWMFGSFVHPEVGAGIGVVFLVARFIYRSAYIAGKSRALGFGLTMASTSVLLLGSLVGVLLSLFSLRVG